MLQKLSLSKKFEIMAYFEMGIKQKEIAKKFLISQSTAFKIKQKLIKQDNMKEKQVLIDLYYLLALIYLIWKK